MRRTALLFALVIMINCLHFSAIAIEADGEIQSFEWEGSTTSVLFENIEESGCNIEQAVVRYNYDSELRELSLAFACIENAEINEEHNTGVNCSINGEKIIVTDEAEYDSELFDIEFGRKDTSKNGFVYEMKIILKKLGYEKIDLVVFFTDTFGIPSKEYKINVYDKVFEETTAPPLQNIASSEAKTNKTTTAKTTKPKTTKEKKTKVTTEKTRKTNVVKTTVTTESETSKDAVEKVTPENKKVLRYISVGGIVTALMVIVVSSARGDD